VPCIAVVAGCLWTIYAYREELAAIGKGDSHVEERIFRRLDGWATAELKFTPVVVFGDSLNVCATPPDKNFDRVGRWMKVHMQEAGTQVDLLDLTHPGLQPLHAYAVLDEALARPVQLMVIEVNVRAFVDPSQRPGADRLPQLARELSAGEAWRVRSNLTLDGMSLFDPPVYRFQESRGVLHVFDGLRQVVLDWLEGTGNSARDALGLRKRQLPSFTELTQKEDATYLVDYAGHPVAQTLRAIADALHERNVPVIFFVAPIDVERLAGTGQYDPRVMTQLLQELRRVVGVSSDEWLDLHAALPSDLFRDKNNHLKMDGCARVGRPLGQHALQRLAGRADAAAAAPPQKDPALR